MAGDRDPRCVILGGGGHALVVVDAWLAGMEGHPYAVLDQDPLKWGKDLLGVPIRGSDELLPDVVREGASCFVVGVGGAGDNRCRQRLFELASAHGLRATTVLHPRACCSAWARVGGGTVVLAMAVVNAGAVVGENVIVNTGAIVEHDCLIGNHAHIATGARVTSRVQIGQAAHVGAGATIRQGLRIGEGAVIGAGAVVIQDVAPWTVVAGVPARPLPARARSS